MSSWEKHFQEQVINKGDYIAEDEFILTTMFENLVLEVQFVDEGGQLIQDEELIDAYYNVIWQYLTPSHYSIFQRIVADMVKEAEEQEKSYHQKRGYANV